MTRIPLDAWDRLLKHADEDKLPDPENTYRFKTFGLFYVAPAQDSFMLRLRVPGCELSATQLHGFADLANECGGGYAHITTRGNLQIREFKPRDIVKVLTRVQELGLTSRGAGADNIRNVTASPNSGFDPDELLDVRAFRQGAASLHSQPSRPLRPAAQIQRRLRQRRQHLRRSRHQRHRFYRRPVDGEIALGAAQSAN